jgi:hypothetical protein
MSYVRRFLALGPDDEEADDGFGTRVYTRSDPNVCTSVTALRAAYSAFVRKHHPEARALEVVDRATLELMGFELGDMNVCKACLMHAAPPAPRCCARYSRNNRKKLLAVVGLALVRELPEAAEDELGDI